MKYTQEYMTKLFHYVNDELFAGMLDMPEMYTLDETYIQAVHSKWGLPEFDGVCVPEGDHYFIGIYNDLSEIDFFNVFVHELIHIYCMEYHQGFSGHWGWFRVYCNRAFELFYNGENYA